MKLVGVGVPGVFDLNFGGKRILIAEDQVLVGLMLADAVAELGFKTQLVHSLADAMDQARSNPPDVALLDVNLSDGISLPVAELLAQRGIPSIYMTGDPGAVEVRGLKAGTVIGKPFAPAELQYALAQALTT